MLFLHGCDAVWPGNILPAFRKNILSSKVSKLPPDYTASHRFEPNKHPHLLRPSVCVPPTVSPNPQA
jgi:hypothetical protein